MTSRIQKAGAAGINTNLAPDAFSLWAKHYLKCESDFVAPEVFSPVPYFLLTRSLELSLKAIHLLKQTQSTVKGEFGHNVFDTYRALESACRVLAWHELRVLARASALYRKKGFEYFDSRDALTGYSRYPNLQTLRAISHKMLEQSERVMALDR